MKAEEVKERQCFNNLMIEGLDLIRSEGLE